MSDQAARCWDDQAATFDDEADHGLRDPSVRSAWRELLCATLPPAPAEVVDLGCGTGTLSVLLAGAGYRVRGLDLSGSMLDAAKVKAATAGVELELRRGDAAQPPYPSGSCDVVLARHVLWTLTDPAAALARWLGLLRPGGSLVLIEGRWSTGAGIAAADCEAWLREQGRIVWTRRLDEPELWGRHIDDERYLVVSPPAPSHPG